MSRARCALGAALWVIGCDGAGACGGVSEIVDPAPIRQDITRAAFLHQAKDSGDEVVFSTLQSYGRGNKRFLLAEFTPSSGGIVTRVVLGSAEARSYAYADSLGAYVLGTSLDPQLVVYDPATGETQTVFRGPRYTAWIHRLAVRDYYAFTVLSTSTRGVPRFSGILRVHLGSGRWNVIPFPTSEGPGYGGVESVDPTGRVWLYRAYPYRALWYDSTSGFVERHIAGTEGWTVASWDTWQGHAYATLANHRGELAKRRINLERLQLVDDTAKVERDSSTQLFLEAVPVDLFHTAGPALAALYYHPSTATFYHRDAGRGPQDRDRLTRLGYADLGELQLTAFHGSPQESALRWLHPTLGELEVLGAASGALVIWLRGRKTLGRIDLATGHLKLSDIPVRNLAPADITALAAGPDGSLYGGGALTMSHLFRFDPRTEATGLLKGAVPNAEGQVNALWLGVDGMLYGAGYPDAVPFRFDPRRTWMPGRDSASNPRNLGPLGHGGQSRARRGIQDLHGRLWLASVSDYTAQTTHALARVDFERRRVDVRTDAEQDFPRVDDLAVFDSTHLILLGVLGGRPGLFALNVNTFQIERRAWLPVAGGVLANPRSRSPNGTVLLAQGRRLYRVDRDLAPVLLHRALGPITNILPDDSGSVLIVGPRQIEHRAHSGTVRLWWRSGSGSRPLFRDGSWTPAVYLGGTLYVGDGAQLRRFRPSARCN